MLLIWIYISDFELEEIVIIDLPEKKNIWKNR